MEYEDKATITYDDLSAHVGHDITIGPTFAGSGPSERVSGASIDCNDCGETILVVDK
jgi:hypothetical protein